MSKWKFLMLVSIAVLTFALMTGCSMDRWVEVRGGDYIPIDAESAHDFPATDLINSMYIDWENDSIKLILADGSTITNSFSARPKQEWPSGCPANLGSTRMEVLDFEVNEITIGNFVINDPILVRNCPDNPERVILREDGQIGGAGTACSQDDKCIYFKPGKPSEPMHSPRALSENEKDLAVNIAVSSSELEDYLEQSGTFQTELRWLARLCDEPGSCTVWQIDYNWQEDAGFGEVPEAAVWYPAVLVSFIELEPQQVLVAVDLDRETVIYSQKIPEVTGQSDLIMGLPYITGLITDVQSSAGNEISGQIMVELDESDGTSDRYLVIVPQNTLINDCRQGTRDIASFSDLKTGQNIQVWFSSPVRESYPAQVDAQQIDIVLNEEFAIYILEETVLTYEMPIISHVELPEVPIISITDIISYSNMAHEIELTPEAYQRIQNLKAPRVFVVAVARQPIYWGTYWAPWFSQSIEDGVVILKPMSPDRQTIQIDLGYPAGTGLFTGDDPRPNPILMKSLERMNRLID